MNCNTGEITRDQEILAQWLRDGDPVMELPAGPSAPESELLQTIGAVVIDSSKDAEQQAEAQTRRFVDRIHNTARLRQLAGRR